jgi:hypothetical protein
LEEYFAPPLIISQVQQLQVACFIICTYSVRPGKIKASNPFCSGWLVGWMATTNYSSRCKNQIAAGRTNKGPPLLKFSSLSRQPL